MASSASRLAGSKLIRYNIGHSKRASLLKMDAIADVRSKLEFEQFHSFVSLDGLRKKRNFSQFSSK